MGQFTYDPDKYDSREEALESRRRMKRALNVEGYYTRMWTLTNQQRGYSGLGTERDYSCRNVYLLDYWTGK